MTDERSPVDQLVDLFIYAPIGLLYERDEVLSRLVTRGRSQVQLARVVGQLAVQRGQGQLEERLSDVLGPSGAGIARFLTELGEALGLAPPSPREAAPGAPAPVAHRAADPGVAEVDDPAVESPAPPVGTAAEEPPAAGADQDQIGDEVGDAGGVPVGAGTAPIVPSGAGTAGEEPPAVGPAATKRTARPSLPIAGYDQLPARQVIPLLVDLSPAQRRVIRDHELSHRGRKTILNRIELLGT